MPGLAVFLGLPFFPDHSFSQIRIRSRERRAAKGLRYLEITMGLLNFELANRAIDKAGKPLQNAVRRIYPMASVARAPIFLDPDLTVMQSSDMRSDASGYFGLCYVKNGLYRVEILHPQNLDGPPLYEVSNVEVGTVGEYIAQGTFQSFEDLIADEILSYAPKQGRLTVQPGALHRIAVCRCCHSWGAVRARYNRLGGRGDVSLYGRWKQGFGWLAGMEPGCLKPQRC